LSVLPIRPSFGRVFRNDAGYYLTGFLGNIQNSYDILYVEFYVIYHGLLLVKDMGIAQIVCYFDSFHGINIIKGPSLKYMFMQF